MKKFVPSHRQLKTPSTLSSTGTSVEKIHSFVKVTINAFNFYTATVIPYLKVVSR